LRRDPKLQILVPVVVSDAVDVVDVLVPFQQAPQALLHAPPVLCEVSVGVGVWMVWTIESNVALCLWATLWMFLPSAAVDVARGGAKDALVVRAASAGE